MLQEAPVTNVEMDTMEESSLLVHTDITEPLLSDAQNEVQTSSILTEIPDQIIEEAIGLSESPTISEINSATAAISTQITPSEENSFDCNVIESPVEMESPMKQSQNDESSVLLDAIMSIEQTNTSVTENRLMINDSPALVTPTTPSVPKERKRRIIIDDDDESPTFNPLRSNKKMRGKNRRNKHNLLLKKQKKAQLLSTPCSSSFIDKANESAVFTSPEVVVRIEHSIRFVVCSANCTFYHVKL